MDNTSQVITESCIEGYFEACKRHCFSIYPSQYWIVKPAALIYSKHKTKYGMAYSDGRVAVNSRFVGSLCRQQLQRTLLHELAHLAVGLDNGHNTKFQQMNNRFSLHLKNAERDPERLTDRIGYQFWLIAHLMNGEVVKVKPVHRRSKQYLEYKARFGRYYTIAKQRVSKFEYQDY